MFSSNLDEFESQPRRKLGGHAPSPLHGATTAYETIETIQYEMVSMESKATEKASDVYLQNPLMISYYFD